MVSLVVTAIEWHVNLVILVNLRATGAAECSIVPLLAEYRIFLHYAI